MAASPNIVSRGDAMIFKQSEATAAEATWLFYLSNTADGTPATGKAIAGTDFRISKNGAAFANAAGTVTEVALGWYKMVFAAADLDTIGALACELSVEVGVDTLHVTHQVVAYDLNVTTVIPPDGGLTAAKFGSDALAAISAALDSKVIRSTLAANGVGDTPVSMANAIDATVEVTGTFSSGSAQVQTTEDAAAVSPVWTNRGSALTANGSVVVAGPHAAIRVNLTGATTPALAVKTTIRKPVSVG